MKRPAQVIAYRLLTVVHDPGGRVVALAALVVVMPYNELWNYAFFGLRSTFAGFLGMLAFLAPLAVLQVVLAVCWPLASSIGQTTQHDSQASCAHITMILSHNKEANNMRSSRVCFDTVASSH